MLPLALGLVLACCGCNARPENGKYPGFTRRSGNIFLMENHCHSLVAWHMMGVSNATVVHIDAHDDCRPVSDSNIEHLAGLLDAGDYEEVFLQSDTGRFLDLKARDADMLYDLGNFIYPSMKLGLISNVYWIVPQPVITDVERRRLGALMKKNLPGSEYTEKRFPAGGFELKWEGRLFRVITFEELPDLPDGCLLDLDIDVFAFPKAMTEEHLIARVNREPEDVFRYLRDKVPQPAAITISASVWGGYLPLLMRPLADAAYDFYKDGTYPEDARALLDSYRNIQFATPESMPATTDRTYLPASLHFTALTYLSRGEVEEARQRFSDAAALLPVYRKGFLDGAEALSSMQRHVEALEFIKEFEERGGETYNSLAVRALALLKAGDPESASGVSSRLTDWDRNPYTLLIHGGSLVASGRILEAEEVFKEIVRIAPHHASAHFNLALLHKQAGNRQAAIKEYRAAIASRPDFWQAMEELGHILLEEGSHAEAEEILKKCIAINPYSVVSLNNLGVVMARQEKLQRAIEVFQRGMTLAPENGAIVLNLADTLHRSGETREAIELCQRALKTKEQPRVRALLESIQDDWPDN